MRYRRFGKTNLRMPVLSCGGMRYQHKWQDVAPGEIPPENQANLEATIRRAIELGINHIETARGYGSSEMQLYCLARPEIHTLSCGAAKPSDFNEHIRALEFYDSMAETIAPIEKRIRAEMARALGADWCLRWHEGVPEYLETPEQVNILEILRLWMFAKSLDLVEWGKMRYNLLGGNGGHWFPGEMSDKMDEKRLMPVLEKSPFAARIPGILREAHQLLFDEPKKRLSQS